MPLDLENQVAIDWISMNKGNTPFAFTMKASPVPLPLSSPPSSQASDATLVPSTPEGPTPANHPTDGRVYHPSYIWDKDLYTLVVRNQK